MTMPLAAAGSMEWVCAPSRGSDAVGRLAVVELAVPGIVGKGVDVGDGLAVKDHADELGGAPAGQLAFRRVGVAALAAVHHEALDLVGDVGGHVGDDGAGAAYGNAVPHQRCGLPPLVRANQVQATQLVVAAPPPPIAQGIEPFQYLAL